MSEAREARDPESDDDLDLLRRPPPPHNPPTSLPTFHHDWLLTQGLLGSWTCGRCGVVANTGFLQLPALEGCRGWSVVLTTVGVGHRIVRYEPLPTSPGLPPLYACELCHRASSHRAVFAQNCNGQPTRSRSEAYRRVERGQHPHPRNGNRVVYSAGAWTHMQRPTQPIQDSAPARPGVLSLDG